MCNHWHRLDQLHKRPPALTHRRPQHTAWLWRDVVCCVVVEWWGLPVAYTGANSQYACLVTQGEASSHGQPLPDTATPPSRFTPVTTTARCWGPRPCRGPPVTAPSADWSDEGAPLGGLGAVTGGDSKESLGLEAVIEGVRAHGFLTRWDPSYWPRQVTV